jgi:hypothetical protein
MAIGREKPYPKEINRGYQTSRAPEVPEPEGLKASRQRQHHRAHSPKG